MGLGEKGGEREKGQENRGGGVGTEIAWRDCRDGRKSIRELGWVHKEEG